MYTCNAFFSIQSIQCFDIATDVEASPLSDLLVAFFGAPLLVSNEYSRSGS